MPAGMDAFVTKLNAAGTALVYSTYLGGSGDDEGRWHRRGHRRQRLRHRATTSTDFPTSHAAQASYGGGTWDAFVTKLNATGSALVYSTYLGGSGDGALPMQRVMAVSIALSTDASGNTRLRRGHLRTRPTSRRPAEPSRWLSAAAVDAFVTKYGPAGAVVYSTYLGGTGLAIGPRVSPWTRAGNAYLTGYTDSTNLPTTAGAFQTTLGGIRSTPS